MTNDSAPSPPQESRPLDLGLSEGKSMGFAPTSALAPQGPPIGGLTPAGPNPQLAPEAAAAQAAAPPPPPAEGSSGQR